MRISMHIIYIDADACPVKSETYLVAERYEMPVVVVANSPMNVPSEGVELVVSKGFGAADDYIAEHAGQGDIVITVDVPLASRCIKNGARVLGHKGRAFTEDDIGESLAVRDLMDTLRQSGTQTGGPAPMTAKDRSRYKAKLDEMVNAVRRLAK